MGLRTTTSTGLSTIQTTRNPELVLSYIVNSNLAKSRIPQPNVSISGNMAPALTEPLSPTNKLSTSTASTSPRPTSNNLLQNNNSNSVNNNNSKNRKLLEKNKILPKYITPQILPKKDAFQLAFERSIVGINVKGNLDITETSTAVTPSSTAKTTFQSITGNEASSILNNQLTPNGPTSTQISPMGPMCDSSSLIESNSISNKGPTLIEGNDFEEAISAVNRIRKQLENSLPLNTICDLSTQSMDFIETNPDDSQHQQFTQIEEIEEIEIFEELDEKSEKFSDVDTTTQELPSVNINSTVTASESDNIEEALIQLDGQNSVGSEGIQELPSCISVASNTGSESPPLLISALTPTTSAMGLQKEFIKDSVEMDQVLGDMDLLQVFKGFETSTGGEVLCDLALFNDVDMNYEEIVQSVKEPSSEPQKDIQSEIENNQVVLQRKLDFLLRRLRKFQARYMCKHASEEIGGLFEYLPRSSRRKDNDSQRLSSFEDDETNSVTTESVQSFIKSLETTPTVEPFPIKKSKIGRPPLNQSTEKATPVIPPLDPVFIDEMDHVSGLLQTQLHNVQKTIDSDATASSSGGESADEMDTYNNTIQQPLSIEKRAGWQYARERASIASRWLWLNCQITDLEFKIKQHNEFIEDIRISKGPVLLEPVQNPNKEKTYSLEDCGDNNVPSTSSMLDSGNCEILPIDDLQTPAEPVNINKQEFNIDEQEEECFASARTRPYQRDVFKKRKLVQTINFHTVSKKVARPSTIKCQGCQWPMNPCALCTGRTDPTAPRDLPDTMSYLDRVSLLDSGFHPVLSFPEDVPCSIDIEGATSVSDWQNRVSRCTAKSAIKGALAAQKAAEREGRGLNVLENKLTNEMTKRKNSKKHHLDDFQMSDGGTTTPLVANKLGKNPKKKLMYQRKLNRSHHDNSQHHRLLSQHTNHQYLKQHRNSEHFNHHLGHSLSTSQTNSNNSLYKIRKVSSTVTSTNGIINSEFNSSFHHSDSMDGTYIGNASRSRNSSPSHNFGSSNYYKIESFRSQEKRNRNSYDIDNIVIPYSVAAATRVELLPYKEIPTPKWRIIDDNDDEAEADDGDPDANTDAVNDNGITLSSIEMLIRDLSHSECSNDNILPVPLDSSKEISCDSKTASVAIAESNFELKATKPTENLTTIDNGHIFKHLVNNNNQNKNNNNAEEQELNQPNKSLNDTDNNEEEAIEDVSDGAILYRHERALIEERRKFQTFLKFPWSTRSRANRRIDSRTESSGANTPDPTSPAPNTQSVGGDQESIPSPAAPSTPMENPNDHTTDVFNGQINTINPIPISGLWNTVSKRNERKRTVSTKKEKDLSRDDLRRSSTPDIRETIIPPYEPLHFPLSDDAFDTMLRMMPNDHQVIEDCNMSSTTQTILASVCDKKILNNNPTNFIRDVTNNSGNAQYTITSLKKPVSIPGDNSDFDNIGVNTSSSLVVEQHPTGDDYYQEIMNASIPIVGNNINVFTSRIICDSDTESVESGLLDDDPNDPEWKADPE